MRQHIEAGQREYNHWRIHKAVPARGMIGIFDCIWCEEPLVVRLHPENSAGQMLPPIALEGEIQWSLSDSSNPHPNTD